MFPSSETEFLEFGELDHRPLITYISEKSEERRGVFRYDCRLNNKEGFRESVLRGLNDHGGARMHNISLLHRINQSRKQISLWKKRHRLNAEERIKLIRFRLDRAISTGSSTPEMRAKLKQELNQANIDEEIFWKLKSRFTWL